MRYVGLVPCTKDGFPICSRDHENCDVEVCRYFINVEAIGNCVLRVDKHDHFRMQVIADAWGVRRQRVDQLEKKALRKIRKRYPKLLQEMQEYYTEAYINKFSPPRKSKRLIPWYPYEDRKMAQGG